MKKILILILSLFSLNVVYAKNGDFCKKLADEILKIYNDGIIETDVIFKYTALDDHIIKMKVRFLTEFETIDDTLILKNCKQISDEKAVYYIERVYPETFIKKSDITERVIKFKINFLLNNEKWKLENIESDNAIKLIAKSLINSYSHLSKKGNAVFSDNLPFNLKKQTIEEGYFANIKSLKNVFVLLLTELNIN